MNMRLPRVKRAHDPIQFPNNRIRIGSIQYGVGAEIEDDDQATVWRLLRLMDGSRTPNMIVATLLSERPDLDQQSVSEAVQALVESGFVEDAAAEFVPNLSRDEVDRYSRNDAYFSWVDTTPRAHRYEIQGRLKEARVAVVGLGGSGSAVALSLVAAGIGTLRCVDFDVVEVSNLSRQLLYTEEDVGQPKVARAVDRLRRLNHHVRVEGLELRIASAADAASCTEGVDFVVLCADKPNPDIQLWFNDAALETGTTWSLCLYAGPMLTSGIFVPFETPCYRCLLTGVRSALEDDEGMVGEALCGEADENAVIAPSAALTGHFGALEAIYHLTGLGAKTVGRVFHQNLLVYDHQYYVEPEFGADCPACGELRRRADEAKVLEVAR
jgi:molybdopterin-synthase adenylyltransferase